MPLNSSTKIAFVHIPRNGGTYIEHRMGVHKHRPESGFGVNYNHSGDLVHLFGRNLQHLPFEEMLDLVGKKGADYRWFTVIRNPAERMVSILCHTLKRPQTLLSIRTLFLSVITIFKIYLIFQLSGLRKGFFNKRHFKQVSLHSPKEQHLLPQYYYVQIEAKKRGYTVPAIELYPFSVINELHTYIPALNEAQLEGKRPNASENKPEPKNINLSLINWLSKVFYRKDWKLYNQVSEQWKKEGQPLVLYLEKSES